MSEFIGLFGGFVLGLLSSWLFWLWQLNLKPNYKVSDKIAVSPSKKDPTKPVYRIKILNLSGRPIIDMKARLHIGELNTKEVGPGRLNRHSIELLPSSETIVGPNTKKYDPWTITCVHYYTSVPDEKVEELLTDSRKLVLTIHATDGTSNTTTIRRFLFVKSDLINGAFETGKSLKVVQSMVIESPLEKFEQNMLSGL